jgi:translocation and assembly module TamB
MPPDLASQLIVPPPRRGGESGGGKRRRGRDWGAVVAQVLCAAFAVIGLLPLLLGGVVRSTAVRAWAARETERILRDQHLIASYEVNVAVWPAAILIDHLRVESSDGKEPALVAAQVSVRPRFFALLSGRLVVAEVGVSSPVVRLVVRDGAVANLDVKPPKSKAEGPFHAPFDVISVDGARIDLDIEGVHVRGAELDVDVTAEDDPEAGSSFELAVRAGDTRIERTSGEPLRVDDDELCSVDARVRIDPGQILVRRLDAAGYIDLDAAPDTSPGCGLGQADKRRAELALSHFTVQLPAKPGDAPALAGYVHARGPLSVAHRLADLPETDGWVGVTGDVRYRPGMALPEADVHFEAHAIQVAQFHFAQEIQSDLSIIDRSIRSPKTMIRIADGVANLTAVEVRPLDPGAPLKARLDVAGANFTTLMANLGVSQQAHVAWDIKELHAPEVVGTLVPLHIDGDFTAPTANFTVFDRPAKDPARERIIGVREAGLRARFAVRPLALEFQNIHVQMPHSTLSDGFVSIGYHGSLRVDAPVGNIDLVDATPLAAIPLEGQVDLDLHIAGNLSDPHLTADAKIQHFVFADMPFGNVSQAHVDLRGLVVELRDVKVARNKSAYEVRSARLDFGGPASVSMDALISTANLGLHDFLGVFRLDDDPRFATLDGKLSANADLHLALGGPEDPCGGGFVLVHTKVHGDNLALFGEVFDDGDADLTYRWTDRLAGIAGADIDVRGVTFHKVRGTGPSAVRGAVIGSGGVRRGGVLHAQFVVDALPISRIDLLSKIAGKAEGTVSGVISASGPVDGWAAHGAVDVSPLRLHGASLGGSRFTFDVNQTRAPTRPGPMTRCRAPIPPAFDKDAFARDTTSQGELAVDGDLFGGQLVLRHVTVSRQASPQITGDVSMQRADIGALVRAFGTAASVDLGGTALGGELSGDLHVQHLDLADLPGSRLTFTPGAVVVTRGSTRLVLRSSGATISVAADDLIVPDVVLSLQTPGGLGGSATIAGKVHELFRDPDVDIKGELAPLDLAMLVGVVPKVDRALGVMTGSLSIRGKTSSPAVAGALHLKGGELSVRGLPSAISDLDVDVTADASEIRIAHGSARFAGGAVRASGSVPITKEGLGRARVNLGATDVHLAPAEGVSATFDADLEVTTSVGGTAEDALPHVTGDVTVTSFEYTRPVNIDLNALGGKSKKTDAPTYDPTRDAVRLDVALKSRVPLRIRNNLVEASLAIDTGAVMVTGTNELFGLRGGLKVLPGGRFHILANDFDVKQGQIRFDDATRIVPNVDILAVTEYRRYTDTTTAAAAGAGAGPEGIASQGAGNVWRISLHAYGDVDDLHLDMTSDPPLSHEDIVLLLTIGMTGAEVAQVQAGSLGTSAALEALATASGADRAVKNAIPLIDDFRFGSAYSSKTGRTEPQLILGKHLADAVRATVATSVGEDQELRATVEWRLSQRLGILGSYDNINDVSSSTVGNVGADLRWHIEFE